MQTQVKEFLATHAITQSMLARSIGVSAAQVSQWLKNEYKGDVSGLEVKLADFMRSYTVRGTDDNAIKVVKTADMKGANFIMSEAVICREMCIIAGEAGCGKTTVVKEFVKNNPTAIFLEAIPGMGITSFLTQLCYAVGVGPSRASDEMVLTIAKEFRRREAVLVVDEAENLTTATLEAIRRIWDFSGVPTILAGTNNLFTNLKGRNGELLQLYTRFEGVWKFQGLGEEDLAELFGEHAPVISKLTTNLRRAANIYKKASRLARMENKPLSAAHIHQAASLMILG